MSKSNLSRWISLITTASCQGHHKEALHIFHQMRSLAFPPNHFIFPSLLRSCSHLSYLETGRSLHNLAIQSLLTLDPFICSALIDMYSKCGKLQIARQVFDGMPERDLVFWNSMISGYTHFNLPEHALVLMVKVQSHGLKPDILTWNALISGFSQMGHDRITSDLFRLMQIDGIVPDVFSWTSLISGFVQNFNYVKAFSVFRRMVVFAGVRPSSVTVSSLLPACANVMDLRRGKEIHSYALVIGVEKDLFVSSSLVDMYAKCGLISEAEKVFDKMTERTSVSWNSMIFGYSNHGYSDKAIRLFYLMQVEGVMLDHLTYTAVFTACSHAGMIELGKKLFILMQDVFGIEPRLEHYACMIDLLGRSGKLDEAYDFIQKMSIKPDSFVSGALLGACRNYRNLKLAEIAASHLRELEPESSGSHGLLSNVLMDAGRWNDAFRINSLMRKEKLNRYLGCSWLQGINSFAIYWRNLGLILLLSSLRIEPI